MMVCVILTPLSIQVSSLQSLQQDLLPLVQDFGSLGSFDMGQMLCGRDYSPFGTSSSATGVAAFAGLAGLAGMGGSTGNVTIGGGGSNSTTNGTSSNSTTPGREEILFGPNGNIHNGDLVIIFWGHPFLSLL